VALPPPRRITSAWAPVEPSIQLQPDGLGTNLQPDGLGTKLGRAVKSPVQTSVATLAVVVLLASAAGGGVVRLLSGSSKSTPPVATAPAKVEAPAPAVTRSRLPPWPRRSWTRWSRRPPRRRPPRLPWPRRSPRSPLPRRRPSRPSRLRSRPTSRWRPRGQARPGQEAGARPQGQEARLRGRLGRSVRPVARRAQPAAGRGA
jgi:hypothetical protein